MRVQKWSKSLLKLSLDKKNYPLKRQVRLKLAFSNNIRNFPKNLLLLLNK